MAGPSKLGYKDNYIIKKCCIIGLGLIGGSLGLALGKYGIALERWGNDTDPLAMEKAINKGAVDKISAALPDALEGSDLVILSAPVGKIPALLEQIAPHLDENALITDVGSSKETIVGAMQRILPGASLGGHPMAGSEHPGMEAAGPDLFQNAAYFLTPVENTPAQKVELMEKIVLSIGARPRRIDAGEHDRIMAPLSHLPQLVSYALVNVLGRYGGGGGDNRSIFSLAGNGLKDMTRIAAGDPLLWLDILSSNKSNLKDALELFIQEMQTMLKCLNGEDKDGLCASLHKAAALRRGIT